MLFVINKERLIDYLNNSKFGKINGVYDWTFTEEGVLYVFIHHVGREYVYYCQHDEFNYIPTDIKIHLDKSHEMYGVLDYDFFQRPEHESPSINDMEDNLFPELNKVNF